MKPVQIQTDVKTTRLSEKKLLTTLSIGDLERGSVDLISNARALHPDSPAANLLEPIYEMAEPEFLAELDRMLRAKYFLRLMLVDRIKAKREERASAWLTPEIREAALILPLRVPIGGDKEVPRSEMEYADTGRYLKYLDKEARDDRRTDKRRLAVKALRKLWPRAQRARRMKLSEVDIVKAKRAGLI